MNKDYFKELMKILDRIEKESETGEEKQGRYKILSEAFIIFDILLDIVENMPKYFKVQNRQDLKFGSALLTAEYYIKTFIHEYEKIKAK